MTANKNAKATPRSGGTKSPQEIPDRCHSAFPPAILSSVKDLRQTQLSDTEDVPQPGPKLRSQRNWSCKTASLRPGSSLSAEFEPQSRLTKAKSIGHLDKKLSIYRSSAGSSRGDQDQKENQPQEGPPAGDGLCPGPLSWSTLSLASSVANHGHKRTLSLSLAGSGASSATIRKKISEWECRKEARPRMSLCLEKRPGGGSEGCPSLLSFPCSDKTFDFKSVRRMSTAFSECSYPETEEEDGTSDRECLRQFQKREREKRSIKNEPGIFLRNPSARKETSAVLNRIQKIEQALKDSPSQSPPQYLNNCYGLDKPRHKPFTFSGMDDLDSTCGSKRSSICSVATEPDTCLASENS